MYAIWRCLRAKNNEKNIFSVVIIKSCKYLNELQGAVCL